MFVVLGGLLIATVHQTVVRNDLGKKVPELVREVAELESEFLVGRGDITLVRADDVELVVVENGTTYLNRNQNFTYAQSLSE
jgi:hypothetical protein